MTTATSDPLTCLPLYRCAGGHRVAGPRVRLHGSLRSSNAGRRGGACRPAVRRSIGVSSASASAPDSPWARVRQLHVRAAEADPDVAHDRAVAAGAEIVSPLQDMAYGSRDFWLRDPGGHLWGFGTCDTGATSGDPVIWPELQAPGRAGRRRVRLQRALDLQPTPEEMDGNRRVDARGTAARRHRRHAQPASAGTRGDTGQRRGCASTIRTRTLRSPGAPERRSSASRRRRRMARGSTPPGIRRDSCGGSRITRRSERRAPRNTRGHYENLQERATRFPGGGWIVRAIGSAS